MSAVARGVALLGLCLALSAQGSAAATNRFRFAVPWPPGSKAFADLQDAARDISRKTDQRVQVEFVEQHDLDSGAMACDGAMLAGSVLARRSPASMAYSLPLLFRASAEALRFRGRMEEAVSADLEGQGLATIALTDLGFAYLLSRAPVETVDQLKAVRLWVPASEPEAIRQAESCGMLPVPLPATQVREALRRGEIDAILAPPLAAIVMQWHVEIRCALSDPFLRLCAAVVLRHAALERLDEADRALVRAELARAFMVAADDLRSKEGEALAVLVKNGVEFRSIGDEPGRRADWAAWAADAGDRLAAAGSIPGAWLQEIRRTAAESRTDP